MNDAMLAVLSGITKGAGKHLDRRQAQKDMQAEMALREEQAIQAEERDFARRKALAEFEEQLNQARYQPGGVADLQHKMDLDKMLTGSYYDTVSNITSRNLGPIGARSQPGSTPPTLDAYRNLMSGAGATTAGPGAGPEIQGPPPPPTPKPKSGGGTRKRGGGKRRSGGGKKSGGNTGGIKNTVKGSGNTGGIKDTVKGR